jgi:hypothetical protein
MGADKSTAMIWTRTTRGSRPFGPTGRLVRAGLLIAALAVLSTPAAAGAEEGSSMSLFSKAKPLLWQGAAGRKPVRFVSISVTRVKAERGGSFGIGQNPSIEGAFPDARNVEGRALDQTLGSVTARAPASALPAGLAAGQRAVLGLVDDRHVICILVPPADVPVDGLGQWAAAQRCE